MSRQFGDEELLTLLTAPIKVDHAQRLRAERLLNDHLHCLYSGITTDLSPRSKRASDPLSLARSFAKASSRDDLDDVDWRLLTHPGSIVNSAIISFYLQGDIDSEGIVEAMIAGYFASAVATQLFDPGHSKRWHATATAGIFGAARASGSLLRLDDHAMRESFRLASAAIGGGSNASISRNGATRFTRIHATVMGLLATLEAREGAPAPESIVEGVGGLASRFDLVSALPVVTADQAFAGISLRIYPWSGFSHGALTALRSHLPSDAHGIQPHGIQPHGIQPHGIQEVIIRTPTRIFPLVGSEEKGAWWSIAAAVRNTLLSGDPMVRIGGSAARALDWPVTVIDSGSDEGSIEIRMRDSRVEIPFAMERESGFADSDATLVERKWRDLAGDQSEAISGISSNLAHGVASEQTRADLLALLRIN